MKCSTNGCECKHTAGERWLRCQGASPDLCQNRLCPNHEALCEVCFLPACEDHLHTVGRERLCTNCLRQLSADGDERALEALASKIIDEVERDLCSQPEAKAWAAVAASGRQPHWWMAQPIDNDDTPEFMERMAWAGDAWDNMPAFDNDSEGDVRF